MAAVFVHHPACFGPTGSRRPPHTVLPDVPPVAYQYVIQFFVDSNKTDPGAFSLIGPCSAWLCERVALVLTDLTGLLELELDFGLQQVDVSLRVAVFLPHLVELTELQAFKLKRCCMCEFGIETLAEHLRDLTQLQELAIGNCQIGLFGAQVLCPVIVTLTQLCNLKLGDNGLGADAAALVAPMLAALTGLQRLGLSWNCFENSGIALLAPVVGKLSALQKLDLKEVGAAGASGAQLLMRCLGGQAAPLSQLTHLDLADNRLGLESVLRMDRTWSKLPCLQLLDLRRTVSRFDKQRLRDSLKDMIVAPDGCTVKI